MWDIESTQVEGYLEYKGGGISRVHMLRDMVSTTVEGYLEYRGCGISRVHRLRII